MQVIAPDNTKEVLHEFKDKYNELKFYNDNTLSWIRDTHSKSTGKFYILGPFKNALREMSGGCTEMVRMITEVFNIMTENEYETLMLEAAQMWDDYSKSNWTIRPEGITIDGIIIE